MRFGVFSLCWLLLLEGCSHTAPALQPFEACSPSRFTLGTFACSKPDGTPEILDWGTISTQRMICVPSDTLKVLGERAK